MTSIQKKILIIGYSSFVQRRVIKSLKKIKNIKIFISSKSHKIDNNKKIFFNDYEQALKTKKFDYVYSWGVLHHTGNLKKSLINTESLCKKKGFIHIALYNDQGKKSKNWKIIKKKYVTGNIITKKLLELLFFPFFIILYSIE